MAPSGPHYRFGRYGPLARQLARSHQEFVDRARALATFADRPHDERLAAAHVAGGEHAIDAGAVVVGAGPRIAARVARDAERIEYAGARACEAHRQQHELGLDRELRARYFGHSHLSVRIPRPVDARADEPLDAAVATLEALRRDRPVTLASLFLRRRRAQLDRPVGPRQRLVFVLGRLRQQFELHDRQRALAVGRADAVGPGVATADDDHVLAGRGQLRLHAIAGDDTVLLRQEIHREMNARELAALHAQVARLLGAAGQCDGVEFGDQCCRIDIDADVRVGAELDALFGHLRRAPVNQVLFHLEDGNAIAHQSADAVGLFEQNDAMPGARELLRAREARGSRADDRDATAAFTRGRHRRDPALLPPLVDDEVLDRLDAHRIVVDVERARGFAGCGADAPGELGEIVGRMQRRQRRLPLVPVDQVVPVRNDVVDWAAGLAERNSAIHAARTLLRRCRIVQRQHELAVMLEPLGDRLRHFGDALELEESGDLAHCFAARFVVRRVVRRRAADATRSRACAKETPTARQAAARTSRRARAGIRRGTP